MSLSWTLLTHLFPISIVSLILKLHMVALSQEWRPPAVLEKDQNSVPSFDQAYAAYGQHHMYWHQDLHIVPAVSSALFGKSSWVENLTGLKVTGNRSNKLTAQISKSCHHQSLSNERNISFRWFWIRWWRATELKLQIQH